MKTQIVYKVSRKDGPKQVSSNADTNRRVKYKLDKLTRPNKNENPFLFLFKTEANAKAYAKGYSNRHVFKGIGLNPERVKTDKYGAKFRTTGFPRGTVFVDAFLPLEKI